MFNILKVLKITVLTCAIIPTSWLSSCRTTIRFLGKRSIIIIHIRSTTIFPLFTRFLADNTSNEMRSRYKFSRLIYWHQNWYLYTIYIAVVFGLRTVVTYVKRDNLPCWLSRVCYYLLYMNFELPPLKTIIWHIWKIYISNLHGYKNVCWFYLHHNIDLRYLDPKMNTIRVLCTLYLSFTVIN